MFQTFNAIQYDLLMTPLLFGPPCTCSSGRKYQQS